MTLTPKQVAELFRYDETTGDIYWRKARMGRKIGVPAGHQDATGYRRVMVDGKQYLAHRIIWCLHNGAWPTQVIDHKNGNPENNRIENLRDVSRSANQQNSKRATPCL